MRTQKTKALVSSPSSRTGNSASSSATDATPTFGTCPGGGSRPERPPWQAVIREVKEETGIEVQVEILAGICSKPEVNEVVFSFVCTVIGGSPVATDEADRVAFFAVGSLPPNSSPKQVERIHDALDHRDQVVMKVQRGRSSIELAREGKL